LSVVSEDFVGDAGTVVANGRDVQAHRIAPVEKPLTEGVVDDADLPRVGAVSFGDVAPAPNRNAECREVPGADSIERPFAIRLCRGAFAVDQRGGDATAEETQM